MRIAPYGLFDFAIVDSTGEQIMCEMTSGICLCVGGAQQADRVYELVSQKKKPRKAKGIAVKNCTVLHAVRKMATYSVNSVPMAYPPR